VTRTDSLALWAVLAALFVVAETLAHLGAHRVRSIGSVAAPLLARTPWRIAILLGWMWLGWHFFAR
jgi:hypothetical protein